MLAVQSPVDSLVMAEEIAPKGTLYVVAVDNRSPAQIKQAEKMRKRGERRTDWEMVARRKNRIVREQHEKAQREKLHAQIEAEGPRVWTVDEAVLEKRKKKAEVLRHMIKMSEMRAKEESEARKAYKARRIKF